MTMTMTMMTGSGRSNCYTSFSTNENHLIPKMLSELAFNEGHHESSPIKTMNNDDSSSSNNNNNRRSSSSSLHDHHHDHHDHQQEQVQVQKSSSSSSLSFLSSWTSGLFCFSFDDPDMFYDAEEVHLEYDGNGKHILTKDEELILKSLRGGDGGNGANNFTNNNNNNSSNSNSNENIQNHYNVHQQQQQQHQQPPTKLHTPRAPARKQTSTLSSSSRSTTNLSQPTRPKQSSSSPSSQQQHHNHHQRQLSYKQSASSLSYYSWTSDNGNQQNHPPPPHHHHHQQQCYGCLPSPPPPKELPLRFLRAGKNDPIEGRRRYEATLQWRRDNNIDTILLESHPNFTLIKKHYPHYYHLRGRNGEPVFFERPPKTNLQALKSGGIDLQSLVRHYTMVTEFQWQFIERDDLARSITVLDLDGMRMRDFVGECVEYVKMCSSFTGQHYPERAGHVIVINVPRWFSMIWNVVKPMVDDVTLQKISIVRGKHEVLEALKAKIPIENIPPEYGGKSMPLGQSPEERDMNDLMAHNNAVSNGDYACGGRAANCRFCSWGPVRSY
jgi:hypothetical protein